MKVEIHLEMGGVSTSLPVVALKKELAANLSFHLRHIEATATFIQRIALGWLLI